MMRSSEQRFLADLSRCVSVWALSLAALFPALVSGGQLDNARSLPAATVFAFLLIGVGVGSRLGNWIASMLHPQTVVMVTTASAAVCWALAATQPWWPWLAILALFGGGAASTFWFSAGSYRSALASQDQEVGPATSAGIYAAAGASVLIGAALALIFSVGLVFGLASVAMAVLTFAASQLAGLSKPDFWSDSV